MKKYALITIMCLPNMLLADNTSVGLTLPGSSAAYGQDSIKAGDLDCKNSIGGATNLEFGLTGIIDNYNSPFGSSNGIDSSKDVGIFARITIPLDKPKDRINCNSLYQLELRKKRLEVLKLQQELEQLRRLNNQNVADFEN